MNYSKKLLIFVLLFAGTMAYGMHQAVYNLVNAINKNNAAEVKKILKDNPGLANPIGLFIATTPLQAAANTGNVTILQDLLNAGAQVDYTENYGMTPLMVAALGGNKEAVEFLIEHGADVNSADKGGQTVLMYVQLGSITTEQQKAEVTQILEDAGAGIEKTKLP